MTCAEFWDGMPELEAHSERWEHAEQCASCAALLRDQRALAAGLRQIGRERAEAPAVLEARLVAAFREQASRKAKPAISRAVPGWWTWAPAAAAVIAVALFVSHSRPMPQARRADPATAELVQQTGEDPATADSDFIPLPYASDSGPADDADLVRLKVPRSALIALGLPVAVDGESGPVEAVVALDADGVMEGVRLVQ